MTGEANRTERHPLKQIIIPHGRWTIINIFKLPEGHLRPGLSRWVCGCGEKEGDEKGAPKQALWLWLWPWLEAPE